MEYLDVGKTTKFSAKRDGLFWQEIAKRDTPFGFNVLNIYVNTKFSKVSISLEILQ